MRYKELTLGLSRISPMIELEYRTVDWFVEVGNLRSSKIEARERFNNKLYSHTKWSPGRFKPGLHWWEASIFTTMPPMIPNCSVAGHDDWNQSTEANMHEEQIRSCSNVNLLISWTHWKQWIIMRFSLMSLGSSYEMGLRSANHACIPVTFQVLLHTSFAVFLSHRLSHASKHLSCPGPLSGTK